jgi:hypothetical protein
MVIDSTLSALKSFVVCDPSVAVPCLSARNVNAGLSDETALRYGFGITKRLPHSAQRLTRVRAGLPLGERVSEIFHQLLRIAAIPRRMISREAAKVAKGAKIEPLLLGLVARNLYLATIRPKNEKSAVKGTGYHFRLGAT